MKKEEYKPRTCRICKENNVDTFCCESYNYKTMLMKKTIIMFCGTCDKEVFRHEVERKVIGGELNKWL